MPCGGWVPEPAGPPLPRIISEEYAEINGQARTKRTYADGTVEFESWQSFTLLGSDLPAGRYGRVDHCREKK